MMSDISAFLYINCRDENQLERLRFYLDPITRPDFPGDVPTDEAEVVTLMETMADPDDIKKCSDTELILLFEEDAFDAKEILPVLFKYFPPRTSVWLELSHDGEAYFCVDEKGFEFVFSPEILDASAEKKLSGRDVSQEFIAGWFCARKEGVTAALLYFCRKYNGGDFR